MNLTLAQIKKIAQAMGIPQDFGAEDFPEYDPNEQIQTVPEYEANPNPQLASDVEGMKAQIEDILQSLAYLDQTNGTQDQSIDTHSTQIAQLSSYFQNMLEQVNRAKMTKEVKPERYKKPTPQPSAWESMKSKLPFGGGSKPKKKKR